MIRDEQREEKIRSLAQQAVEGAKDNVVVHLRYLDVAVYALRPVCDVEKPGFYTDGVNFIYEPHSILRRCATGFDRMSHDYLHVLLHCMFFHIKKAKNKNKDHWNLACDIAVEDVLFSMEHKFSGFQLSERLVKQLQYFRGMIGELTADKLYAYFEKTKPRKLRREELHMIFHVDEHEEWYDEESLPLLETQEDEGFPMEGEQGSPTPGEAKEDGPDWDDIVSKVEMTLDMAAANQEDEGKKLMSALRHLEEKVITYEDFLKKFAVQKEILAIDDGSFDYIPYTYGFSLYEDMPLIEPLETKEEKRIRDVVIVIDSSASTEGAMVESFIRRTFEILKSEQLMGKQFHIRLVQCDQKIQEDRLLQNVKEAEDYLKEMRIKGHGGTDFRVAFQYVEHLKKRKVIPNLKGLIYFTDGKGVFPKKKPSFESAFVFPSQELAGEAAVPFWAIKAVLGEDNEH
ncbi:MAG: VWA-like domain-containing protein [Lachnospiraceae bacterium]|nr:VWA-like domain-containing protein [Lachnospiraceae bacterium]